MGLTKLSDQPLEETSPAPTPGRPPDPRSCGRCSAGAPPGDLLPVAGPGPVLFDRGNHIGYTMSRRICVSGLQEILVIVLIFVLIFFLPRLKGRGGEKRSQKTLQALSGKLRLALVISVVWLLLWTAYFQPWTGRVLGFAVVGLCPVALGWGVLWILDGFRKNQNA